MSRVLKIWGSMELYAACSRESWMTVTTHQQVVASHVSAHAPTAVNLARGLARRYMYDIYRGTTVIQKKARTSTGHMGRHILFTVNTLHHRLALQQKPGRGPTRTLTVNAQDGVRLIHEGSGRAGGGGSPSPVRKR